MWLIFYISFFEILLTYINLYVNICLTTEWGDTLKIKYTKSFDNTRKKLKKYHFEENKLFDIIDIIKNSDTFNDLLSNPICNMYNLERLKYDLNEFYSFRLSRSGGFIRLIIYYNDQENAIYLVFISYNHYNDFNKERVIYYDE